MKTRTFNQFLHSSGHILGPVGKRHLFLCSCGYARLIDAKNFSAEWLCRKCKKLYTDKMSGKKNWEMMLQRCLNPKHSKYRNYGASGIGVCQDWISGRDGMSGFKTFVADMGPRPSLHHSIDRLDNLRGYEPGNCVWATNSEQQSNRTDNVRISAMGKNQTLAEWSRETGLPARTIQLRLRQGEHPDVALMRPHEARGSPSSGVTAFGHTRSYSEWARRIGVSWATVRSRVQAGWTPEEAVSTQRGGRRTR